MGSVRPDRRRPWRPQLTEQERRVGWAFFALYIFLFPFLMGGVTWILDERLMLSLKLNHSNAIYYTIILLLLVAVFWDFLRHAGHILLDNLRPSVFAFGAAFFVGLALTCLFGAIPLPVTNPVLWDDQYSYKAQFLLSPAATWLVVGFLRPAVEEILYRGLLFSSLRKVNRPLAYAVSVGLFALSAVWQHVLSFGNPLFLLLLVQYLPLGLVQCWCYDVSGSVYTPMALRMALSSMFLIFAVMSAPLTPLAV